MTEGPTTMNGPLHAPEATTEDREMIATFATLQAAQAAKARLEEAGIAGERISVSDTAADARAPADDTLVGRVRQAVAPDEGENSVRAAAQDGDAILALRPLKSEVETAVDILRAAGPTHFDAELELWRNNG